MHVVCANIFGAIVLKPRFKIDAVIMIICSIVIIINSVLKGPKHDQVEGEFFYIKQTRMVRWLRDRRKKFILVMIGADIPHFVFLANAEHTLKIM